MRSHHRTRREPAWLVLFLLGLALSSPATVDAQDAGHQSQEKPKNPAETTPPPVFSLKEPVDHRVYQRDRNGLATIPVVVQGDGVKTLVAEISVGTNRGSVRFEDGKFLDVPTGGPYTVIVNVQTEKGSSRLVAQDVYVGDLWVLAGQSNMEGYGDLIDVAPPSPRVLLLGMDDRWSRAEEPLHWLVDSPDSVHSGDPATRAARSAEAHRSRAKGAGLGLPFATAMVQATGVPVGLIASAHGGTSMEQWAPAKKDKGGDSLYGSMLRQVKLAGGKVKGVLWYQGESEAGGGRSKVYETVFTDFIAAVRADFGQPELPFYYVQIGRFVHAADPGEWNAVQEVQRRLVERVANTAVVAVVDLDLDDLIHVGTQGLKRAGERLAKVALRELFGQRGATTPTLDRVYKGAGNTLVVKFKGVNLAPEPTRGAVVGLKPSRHIAGFSIRDENEAPIPLIFDAVVETPRDAVILKLIGPVPEKARLWYGHGYDPYCNLTDGLDMAVPVFGPIPLDELK